MNDERRGTAFAEVDRLACRSPHLPCRSDRPAAAAEAGSGRLSIVESWMSKPRLKRSVTFQLTLNPSDFSLLVCSACSCRIADVLALRAHSRRSDSGVATDLLGSNVDATGDWRSSRASASPRCFDQLVLGVRVVRRERERLRRRELDRELRVRAGALAIAN